MSFTLDIILEFAIAAFLLSRGIVSLYRILKRSRTCTQSTEGIIAGYDEEKVIDVTDGVVSRLVTYTPVISFMAQGRTVRAESGSSRNGQKYAVGSRVRVCYRPDRPEIFYFVKNRLTESCLPGILMIVFGTALFLLGMQ